MTSDLDDAMRRLTAAIEALKAENARPRWTPRTFAKAFNTWLRTP